MIAILDFKMTISWLFVELQGSSLEIKLFTLKYIIGTYFNTNMSNFGFVGVQMAAILDFEMSMS